MAVTVLPQSPPQLCGVALTVKKRAFLCARVPQNYSRNPVCGDHLCLSVCPAGIKVCCRVGIRNLPWSAKEVEQHVYKKNRIVVNDFEEQIKGILIIGYILLIV